MTQRDDAAAFISHNPLETDAAELSARAERPTLMGLAPLEHDAGSSVDASEAPPPMEAAAAPVANPIERSTVRPVCLLASEETASTAPEPCALDSQALHSSTAAASSQPLDSVGVPASASVALEAAATPPAAPTETLAVVTEDPSPRIDPSPVAAEEDPEWLDLSTRWLIAAGPQTAQPIDDDNEVTEHFQWSDRLAVHAFPRAQARRSVAATTPRAQPSAASAPPPAPYSAVPAPPPQALHSVPPLPPPPEAARATRPARPRRPVTLGYGRHAEPVGGPAQAQAFQTQRLWAPAGARHATLAGLSPLEAAPGRWPVAQDDVLTPSAAALPPQAAGAWDGYAPPAPEIPPPWPAMPVMQQPALQPPHPQYSAPSAYAPAEHRPSRPSGYPAYYGDPGTRSYRAPRQHPVLERWTVITDSWFAALFKYALALAMLHYSGLAVPLLALFGYAPEQRAKSESPAPAAANVAAPSVSLERTSTTSEQVMLASTTAQREVSAAAETDSAKPARKPKLATTAPRKHAPALPAEAAAASESGQAASTTRVAPSELETSKRTLQQLMAATPENEEALGEAFLRINSRPWSQVFVDGTHVGHTPKLDLRVRAGAHRIRLVNQELGVAKTIELRAAPGETVSHIEFLEQ